MSGSLHMRQLTAEDLPILQVFLESDPDYARRVTGSAPAPDEAVDLVSSVPPGVAPDQKLVLGVFDDAGLAAVVDVLRGWPQPSVVHIGLLQVHLDRKRQGVGRRAHELLLGWIGGWPEITTLRAAIVATNSDHAEPFWMAQGYRPSGAPKPYRAGDTITEVSVWTRDAMPPQSIGSDESRPDVTS